MYLNGSDISNVKGYAFSRATLTEVSILNQLDRVKTEPSFNFEVSVKLTKIMTFFSYFKLCLFMKNSQVENVSHFSVKSHINLWHNNGWKQSKEIFFFVAKYYYNIPHTRKYGKENIFTVYHYHMLCFYLT